MYFETDIMYTFYQCCACYGPVGGSGVYCGRECKSKNGGTVVKDANAWFWIRLNPPQKVWEKCMEYRTEEENGDAAWYKLIGDRDTPVKVSFKKPCQQSELSQMQ